MIMMFKKSVIIVLTVCQILVITLSPFFRITNFKDECGRKNTSLVKHNDHLLQFKIGCIVFFDSLIWITFIILCLLHTNTVVDLGQNAKAICLCIIPLSSVINPVIFNHNMFFARPEKLNRRQMGLWMTVLVGFGMALGLELQ